MVSFQTIQKALNVPFAVKRPANTLTMGVKAARVAGPSSGDPCRADPTKLSNAEMSYISNSVRLTPSLGKAVNSVGFKSACKAE